jgi:RNA polymerase sigma-70 factor (ECF subfamily)
MQEIVETAWRENRAFAVDLAFRMLNDITEAEDVVQEAFARLLRADAAGISDVRAWLVVVVSRLCLDILRSSRRRLGVPLADGDLDREPDRGGPLPDPADRVTLDESVSSALLVVLENLSPAERTAFVLHDVFGYEFDTVGAIVGRSPQACRQLASRARQRIHREAGPARFTVEPAAHRELAGRFLSACGGGDLAGVMALLDPDVVGGIDLDLRGRPASRRGAPVVAHTIMSFVGPDSGLSLVSDPLSGGLGLLGFRDGELIVTIALEVEGGLISHIDAVRDPTHLENVRRALGTR